MLTNTTFSFDHYQFLEMIEVQSRLRTLTEKAESLRPRGIHFILPAYRDWECGWLLWHTGLLSGSKKRVLDVGCGLSLLPFLLEELGHEVVTCDLDFAHELEVFRTEMGSSIPHLEVDITQITNPAFCQEHSSITERLVNRFDVVLNVSVLEHIAESEYATFLFSMSQCLRSKGILGVTFDFNDTAIDSNTTDPVFNKQYSLYNYEGHTISETDLLSAVAASDLCFVGGYDYTIDHKVCDYTLAAAFLQPSTPTDYSKLDAGCGEFPRTNSLLMDKHFMPHLDVVGDILHLPFHDEVFADIVATDVVEHVHFSHTLELFQELARVLRIGGSLTVRVPDFEVVAERYEKDRSVLWDFPERDWRLFQWFLYNHLEDPLQMHRAAFDELSLRTFFTKVGLSVDSVTKDETYEITVVGHRVE